MSAIERDTTPLTRPMRRPDLDAVIGIERGAYDFPWSPGVFRDCLRVGYCCWVLERHGAVDAYGIMQVAAGEAHVLNLCVRVESQGERLGEILLDRLLSVARDRNARCALLEVRPSNARARRLYERMGFAQIGERRGYYPASDGREDALVLSIDLG